MASKFKLTFDVPHQFSVEPGYVRAVHCHDFRRNKAGWFNCFQDPNTGVLMMAPTFFTEHFYASTYWHPLTSWRRHPGVWQEVYRALPWTNPNNPGLDPANLAVNTANFWTSVDDGSVAAGNLLNNLNDVGVAAATLASAYSADTIKWCMESNFDLARDEGFVLHYRVIGDELHRPKNWMFIQWDDMGIHFSYDGSARAVIYDSTDYMTQPTIIDEFQLCDPGDIIGKEGYIMCIPVPNYGLSLYHSNSAQRLSSVLSSATSGVTRGHLIKTPVKKAAGGIYVHDGGKFRIGLGAVIGRVHHTMGFHALRYPTGTTCQYTGEIIDPGYTPVTTYPTVQGLVIPSAPGTGGVNRQDVTVEYRNKRDTAAWQSYNNANAAAWADQGRQGRMKLTLHTSDARYTPFIQGTYINFPTVLQTRDTTPLEPTTVRRLEFSEDVDGKFEGVATCLHLRQDELTVLERGEATFVIERCDDPDAEEPEWVVQGGGLAQLADDVDVMMDGGGQYYMATWKLHGMEQRFDEVPQQIDTAFDGIAIADAFGVVLGGCGLPPLAVSEIPDRAGDIVLPYSGDQAWRFGTREGDSGEEVVESLLLLMRRQYEEYRLRYDWDANRFKLEQRPRDHSTGNTYVLTPFPDEQDADTRRYCTSEDSGRFLRFSVTPPDANVVQVIGLSSGDNDSDRIPTQPICNLLSLNDPDSPDYAGRVKMFRPLVPSVSHPQLLAEMNRRFFDATTHRRVRATKVLRDYVDALKPDAFVKLRGLKPDKTRGFLLPGLPQGGFWIKRRTVAIDYSGPGEVAPVVTLSLDSHWEGEVNA